MKRIIVFIVLAISVFANFTSTVTYAYSDNDFDYENLKTASGNRAYMDSMMKFYIQTSPQLQDDLRDGNPVLFLFEGASPNANIDPNEQRISASAIIVKCENDELKVTAQYDDCSTLPDSPLTAGTDMNKDSVTIYDGEYTIHTTNHRNEYAALNIQHNGSSRFNGVYLNEDQPRVGNCQGINIHTRRNCDLINIKRSEECQLISFQNGNNGDYNDFMFELTGISNAYDTLLNEEGQYVGSFVVDRYCYRNQMDALYANVEAVNMITDKSVAAKEEFDETAKVFLDSCSDGLCYPSNKTITTLKKTPVHSIPCADNSSVASYRIATLGPDEEISIVERITNPFGNQFYKVILSDGATGYIYYENVMLN